MTCEGAKERMAAGWLGEIGEPAESELKVHLAACAECRAEMAALGGLWARLADLPAPEPSPAMDARWESTMDAILAADLRPARRWSFGELWPKHPVWQAAIALACLLVGIAAGTTWHRDNKEIAKLRNEVASTKALVALSLLQQQSATERLRGVDYSGRLASMEPEIVAALIQAVDRDPSVNVRLAAIDALARASGDGAVLRSLTASLPRQDSPMVQAALVDYLADAHDRQAVATLRALDARPELNPAVRARTQLALRQLSQ
jgi:hypothetical protein